MMNGVMSSSVTQNGFAVQACVRDARRQLNMSVGVVAALAIAIVSAAATFGAHPIAAKRDVAAAAPLATVHAEVRVEGAQPI